MIANILKTIDRAADTLYGGFVSEALGWRGAVIFFVLLGGLIPFGSFVNAFWVGLFLLINAGHADFNLSAGEFHLLCASLLLAGVFGVWVDIKKMASRPVVNRLNPPGTIN